MSTSTRIRVLVLPAAASLAALLLAGGMGGVSPLLVSMVIGVVLVNSGAGPLRTVEEEAGVTRLALKWGIVLLGLNLPVGDVIRAGSEVVAVILVTVGATYVATLRLGGWLRVDRSLVALIAAGTCICGAAAIAAVSEVVRPRQRDLALALALITIQGSVMILALPMAAGWISLSEKQSAVWAGASIHEVAQVVASASVVGGGAVGLAMIVKLGRVALLAPLYLVITRRDAPAPAPEPGPHRVPIVPWFVSGFVCAVAIRSVGVLPEPGLVAANHAATLLLAAGMFGLGLTVRLKDLWPIPWRPLLLATSATAMASGASLLLIVLLIR